MSNVMSKVKGFVKENRKAMVVSAVSALATVTSSVSAFAAETGALPSSAETSENIVSQFNTSLQQMQGDIVNLIITCIPVALTIFGMVIAVNKGIQVTKSMIGKAS